ncbi:MAG: glycosyltransferase family 39 protein [Flavobacteriales bacterium]|nr:glycosyltransferase family 39 protein [Flavobacteriales bacterium]
MKSLFHSSWFYLCLAVILLIPVLFLNNKDTHDWSGDFAMYLQQAEIIVEGGEQVNNNYLFNEEHNRVGPSTYPIGFPLLLSPIYLIFGNDMGAFMSFISICYYLMGLVCFVFFSRKIGHFKALLLSLILCYNPMMLDFKLELMSEIPFTLCLFLTLLLYDRYRQKAIFAIAIGLLIGLIVLIKSLGLAILAGLIIYFILHRKNLDLKTHLLIIASSFAFILTTNIIFLGSATGASGYIGHFGDHPFSETFYRSLLHIVRAFKLFFGGNKEHVLYLIEVVRACGLALVLIGFSNRIMRKKINLDGFIFISFLVVLVVFPYTFSTGTRLLIPVFPLLIYYAIQGFGDIKLEFKKLKYATTLIGMAIVILIYQPEIDIVLKYNNRPINGPLDNKAQECFKFIDSNTDQDATILFQKPRVLGLYANRKSWSIQNTSSSEDIERQMKQFNCKYILSSSDLKNQAIDSFVTEKLENHIVWSNGDFTLYKI